MPLKARIQVRFASDGYPLHYRQWAPTNPCGWILMLHGIQSHSGWYPASCQRFADAGWNVRAPDRRGSGLNPQQRGDALHWKRLLHDVRHFLFDIQSEWRTLRDPGPVLLYGISWGAKLATLLASDPGVAIDGLVLMTPGLCAKVGPSRLDRVRIAIARLLNLRERRVPIPLNDPALFTSLPEQQAMIRDDPLALHELTLSMLFASLDLETQLRHSGPIRCPVQLLLAGKDRIIDNQKTRKWLAGKSVSPPQIHEFPESSHTLELDVCREEFIDKMLKWANARVTGDRLETRSLLDRNSIADL